jgi:hypothetical protein
VAIREFFTEYMIGKACIDCGEADPVCLDFDSDKKFKIADALRYGSLQAELEKCDCRCANCHRKRHRKSKWEHTGKDSNPIKMVTT